jgi:hypothetical protein
MTRSKRQPATSQWARRTSGTILLPHSSTWAGLNSSARKVLPAALKTIMDQQFGVVQIHREKLGTVCVFDRDLHLRSVIEFHTFAPLEASKRVADDILLGCSFLLLVGIVNSVQTRQDLPPNHWLVGEQRPTSVRDSSKFVHYC